MAELTEKFAGHLENYVDNKAIPVAIKKEWLRDGTKFLGTVAGVPIKDVPLIEFSEDAKKEVANDNIWCLGGNHRREALVTHVNTMIKECAEKRAELEAPRVSPNGEEGKDMEDTLRGIETLEAKIAASKHWVIIVYDRGKRLWAVRQTSKLTRICSEDRREWPRGSDSDVPAPISERSTSSAEYDRRRTTSRYS